MRRLAPVDKILERLAALEVSLGTAADTPLSKAATAEKKTLIPEPKVEMPVFSGPVEPDEPFFTEPPPETFFEEPPDIVEAPAPYDLSFVEDLPDLPIEIAADRLEHYEHPNLDDAFENELAIAGDDLRVFPLAKELAEAFSGIKPKARAASNGTASNGFSPPIFQPEPDEIDDGELPTLSDNPTEDELFAYAERHPMVRKVKKALRAKIVEVRKLD
jgi:hypothetical protein